MKKIILLAALAFAICNNAVAQNITANPFPGFGTTTGTAIQGPGTLGAATATTLAIAGCTLSTDVFCLTGTATFSSTVSAVSMNASSSLNASTNAGIITLGASADVILSRPSGATLQFGNADTASPVAQTIQFQNVATGTSNVAGANALWNLSRGTGSGIGGNLTLNCAPHGASATVVNTLVSCFTVNGDTRAIGLPGLASSSAAQTGTVCWTTGGGNLTVDTTTTCLLSLEEFKNIKSNISGTEALTLVTKLKPFWFSYKPGYNATDFRVHAGLGAHQVESVDRRLVGYDANGKLTGIRYADSITSLNVAAIQALTVQVADLSDRVTKLGRCKHLYIRGLACW